jgi:hypothetical protein
MRPVDRRQLSLLPCGPDFDPAPLDSLSLSVLASAVDRDFGVQGGFQALAVLVPLQVIITPEKNGAK